MRERGIVFSGVSNLRRGYRIEYSKPFEQYMVIMTTRGEGHLESTNKENYILDGGSIIVNPPGFPCKFYVVDDCWDIIWFYLKKDSMKMQSFSPGLSYWHDTYQFPEMSTAMEGYLHEHENMHSNIGYVEKAAKNYAELIVITLDRILERNYDSKNDSIRKNVDSIWLAVKQDVSRDWQMAELAAHVGTSQSTFQRYMRKTFNCTPKQMLLNIRMEEAKQLLTSTRYPMKTIAERLNYSDEFAFSYAFKRHTGVPPRQFRSINSKF